MSFPWSRLFFSEFRVIYVYILLPKYVSLSFWNFQTCVERVNFFFLQIKSWFISCQEVNESHSSPRLFQSLFTELFTCQACISATVIN